MAVLADGTTELLPTKNYAAGSYKSPKLDLSPTQSRLMISAARNNWPDIGGDVVKLAVEISYDDGTTYGHLSSVTARGGNVLNSMGDPAPVFIEVNLPQVGNANRRVLTTATLYAALNTSVSVTLASEG